MNRGATMRLTKPFRAAWIAFGALELAGAIIWCVVGAGIYGSPFAHMEDAEAIKVVAFLVVGPLSALPSALVAFKRPVSASCWTIIGGLLSGYIVWFVIPHPNLRGGTHFEAVLPLLLVSVPMLVMGVLGVLQSLRFRHRA